MKHRVYSFAVFFGATLFLLLGLISCAGEFKQSAMSETNRKNREIIDGKEVAASDPRTAYTGRLEAFVKGKWDTYCTGTLLDRCTVLTAAHCMGHVGKFTLVDGRSASFASAQALGKTDMALVRLDSSFPAFVKGVPLAKAKSIPLGAAVNVVGFSDNINSTSILREGTLEFSGYVFSDMVAGGFEALRFIPSPTNSNSVCYGDSGGPAFYNGEQVGVHSHGGPQGVLGGCIKKFRTSRENAIKNAVKSGTVAYCKENQEAGFIKDKSGCMDLRSLPATGQGEATVWRFFDMQQMKYSCERWGGTWATEAELKAVAGNIATDHLELTKARLFAAPAKADDEPNVIVRMADGFVTRNLRGCANSTDFSVSVVDYLSLIESTRASEAFDCDGNWVEINSPTDLVHGQLQVNVKVFENDGSQVSLAKQFTCPDPIKFKSETKCDFKMKNGYVEFSVTGVNPSYPDAEPRFSIVPWNTSTGFQFGEDNLDCLPFDIEKKTNGKVCRFNVNGTELKNRTNKTNPPSKDVHGYYVGLKPECVGDCDRKLEFVQTSIPEALGRQKLEECRDATCYLQWMGRPDLERRVTALIDNEKLEVEWKNCDRVEIDVFNYSICWRTLRKLGDRRVDATFHQKCGPTEQWNSVKQKCTVPSCGSMASGRDPSKCPAVLNGKNLSKTMPCTNRPDPTTKEYICLYDP